MDTLGIYRTRGLGCLAEIVLTDPDSVVGSVDIVHEELDRIDRAASRFRPDRTSGDDEHTILQK